MTMSLTPVSFKEVDEVMKLQAQYQDGLLGKIAVSNPETIKRKAYKKAYRKTHKKDLRLLQSVASGKVCRGIIGIHRHFRSNPSYRSQGYKIVQDPTNPNNVGSVHYLGKVESMAPAFNGFPQN